jgi:hypothetical protein
VRIQTKKGNCKWCGAEFERLVDTIYCSYRCKDARQNEVKARRAQALGMSFREMQRHRNLVNTLSPCK